jgi:hypothetical protein
MFRFFQENRTQERRPSTADFMFRFNKLQRLVVKEGLDGLLLLCGPESLHNPDSARVASWLFNGKVGSLLQHCTETEECLSDLMLLVTGEGCHLYYGLEAHAQYGHYVMPIPNLALVTPSPSIADTPSEVDLLRIEFFFRALSGLTRIGVPLPEG